MSEHKFGALKSDVDIRDYTAVCKSTVSATTFPEEYEITMCKVKDQGSVSSCVAHSIAEIIEYFNKQQEGSYNSMSTAYIYGNRRNSTHKGKGMNVRKALDNAVKFGDCYNIDFSGNYEVPDAIDKFESTGIDVTPNAYPNRISSYFALSDESAMKTSLMQNGPIFFSIPWYKDYKVNSNGILEHTNDTLSGYHAMVIYGWNKNGWKFQNSWGTKWGKSGRAILPYGTKFDTCYGIIDTISSTIANDNSQKLLDEIEKLNKTITARNASIAALQKELTEGAERYNALQEQLNQKIQELEDRDNLSNNDSEKIKELTDSIKQLKEQLTSANTEMTNLAKEMSSIAEERDNLNKTIEEKNKTIEALRSELLQINKPFKDTATWIVKIINGVLNITMNLFSKKVKMEE